jgi:hypothetical protein
MGKFPGISGGFVLNLFRDGIDFKPDVESALVEHFECAISRAVFPGPEFEGFIADFVMLIRLPRFIAGFLSIHTRGVEADHDDFPFFDENKGVMLVIFGEAIHDDKC